MSSSASRRPWAKNVRIEKTVQRRRHASAAKKRRPQWLVSTAGHRVCRAAASDSAPCVRAKTCESVRESTFNVQSFIELAEESERVVCAVCRREKKNAEDAAAPVASARRCCSGGCGGQKRFARHAASLRSHGGRRAEDDVARRAAVNGVLGGVYEASNWRAGPAAYEAQAAADEPGQQARAHVNRRRDGGLAASRAGERRRRGVAERERRAATQERSARRTHQYGHTSGPAGTPLA